MGDATRLSIRNMVRTLRPLPQFSPRIAGHEHPAEDTLTSAAASILEAQELPRQ